MVVTYLVILTVAVAYLGLRLWSAEQYLDQVPKTIGSFANDLTRVELEQVKAKGYAETTRDLAYGTSDRVIAIGPIIEKLKLSAYSVTLDPYETAATIGALSDRLDKLEQANNMVVDRLGRDMDYNAVTYGPLLSLLDKPKKAAKKPRGKK